MNKFIEQMRPTHVASSVEAITPEAIREEMPRIGDIKAIAFDVDGTLMPHHETRVEHDVYLTLRNLAEASFRLYIISNAYGKRVDELVEMFEWNGLGMKVMTPEQVTPAGEKPTSYRKPNPAMLEAVIEETEGDVLMVGDQMAKDILSANRAGTTSVLVPRRGDGDDWRVRVLQRPLEAGVRRYLDLPRTAADYPEELTAV